MKMDPRDVSNVISFCIGMVLDVHAVIISFASNRTITNQREDCLKQYSGFDISPLISCLLTLKNTLIEYNQLRHTYQVTQKGHRFLELYSEMKRILDNNEMAHPSSRR